MSTSDLTCPDRRRSLALLGAGALSALLPVARDAQAADAAYPTKPIKLLVGYPPGGSVDMMARIIVDALGPTLGATLVIDNQGGAAGAVAAQRLVTSPADGYTLMVGSSNEWAATGLVNPAQKYDPLKDITPIGMISAAPVLLVAGPKTGVKTFDEFLALCKRSPGKFSYGTSGVGSSLHFAGELLKQRAGIFVTHIPYRGTAALTGDLAGGTIEFAMLSVTAALPFLQSGRIQPLGVTSTKRLSLLPNVPAIGELPATKGYELSGWFALGGPKGLPQPIVERLRTALQHALTDATVRRRLDENGAFAYTGKEDMGKLMRDEVARLGKLVAYAHMRE